MGLFSSKPVVLMEDFCKLYYDSQMFYSGCPIEGSQNILDASFKLLTEADASFLKIKSDLFESEMIAMHLELFGLAFLRRFPSSDKAVKQSIFTRQYLMGKNKFEIWEAMGAYSKIIAQTATMTSDGRQMSGDTAIGRMTITQVNTFRFGLFEKWIKPYIKNSQNPSEDEKEIGDCVAYVCNRLEADILKHKQIGNRLIAGLFLERLGVENTLGKDWQPSEDFFLRVASQPLSMYEFANQRLKEVDLKFL